MWMLKEYIESVEGKQSRVKESMRVLEEYNGGIQWRMSTQYEENVCECQRNTMESVGGNFCNFSALTSQKLNRIERFL